MKSMKHIELTRADLLPEDQYLALSDIKIGNFGIEKRGEISKAAFVTFSEIPIVKILKDVRHKTNSIMKYDIIFLDPDHNEKIFVVEIEDITTSDDFPRFHAKIPEASKEWSEEPEQQVIDWVMDTLFVPNEITCEFI